MPRWFQAFTLAQMKTLKVARRVSIAALTSFHISILMSEQLDVACQTDPSSSTPVLEPTPLLWTSPPPPNRIVPAVEVAAASNT